MRSRSLPSAGLALGAVMLLVWPGQAAPGSPERGTPASSSPTAASALYDRFCLACHGESGDGRGPAAPFVWPRPRDFRRGDYKWRTTPTGQAPTDADLGRAIRHGVPGTAMHGFAATLGDTEISALVAHLKTFAPRRFARPITPVLAPTPAPIDPAMLARGMAVWTELGCGQCHGTGGTGDGPSARDLRDGAERPAPPYDLTRVPVRRPGAPDEDPVAAIYVSLTTGLDGSPMPSYEGAAAPADLWAVAAYVASIGSPDRAGTPVAQALDPLLVRLDRDERAYRAGYWPGDASAADAAPFGRTLALMGEPPAGLTPAQASPSAAQCGRCHAKQAREWQGSLHAAAGSPGLLAQLIPLEARIAGASEAESCQRCHAPLAEQQPRIRPAHVGGAESDRRYKSNPRFDDELRAEGVTCAACHVRDHRRLGPPRATDGRRLSLFGYPLSELAIYQRADLCLPCHQLAPRAAVAGRPLLDTYREWLEGPYMPRGVQCQHCHMPDREHSFKGVHDRDAFLQGIRLDTLAVRSPNGVVTVRARLTNAGAGHFLPTTPTPAVWLRVRLVDDQGVLVRGASDAMRIGRHLVFEPSGFRQVEDTRIPPGEARELAAAWRDGRVTAARAVQITVEVWPDEYYERLFRSRLAGAAAGEVASLYREALARTVASRYVAVDRLVPISPAP